jgi:hypothetical protein
MTGRGMVPQGAALGSNNRPLRGKKSPKNFHDNILLLSLFDRFSHYRFLLPLGGQNRQVIFSEDFSSYCLTKLSYLFKASIMRLLHVRVPWKAFFSIGAVLLSVVLFVSVTLADICCYNGHCVQSALGGFQQHETGYHANPVHSCCMGTQHHSCQFSKNSSVTLQNFFFPTISDEHQLSTEDLSEEVDDITESALSSKSLTVFSLVSSARSAPIYLRHRSLLC